MGVGVGGVRIAQKVRHRVVGRCSYWPTPGSASEHGPALCSGVRQITHTPPTPRPHQCAPPNTVPSTFHLPTHPTHRMPVARSCFSNSSRSCWLQLRPMGDTLIMPLRNSIKVPRLTGMSMSGAGVSLRETSHQRAPHTCWAAPAAGGVRPPAEPSGAVNQCQPKRTCG